MLYALAAAVGIGLCLGLLGSGGSILTVPVLVYVVGRPEKAAIAESLAIVGLIAAWGAVLGIRRGLVDYREVLWFGGPGMVGTYGGAALSRFVGGSVQLVVFALVMLAAAVLMFRGSARSGGGESMTDEAEGERHAPWALAIEGAGVGVLTGFVGVGGGFLIVPALVLLGSLPMKRAVATSLGVITITAWTGFAKHLAVLGRFEQSVEWGLIGLFGAIGVVGMVVGSHVGGRLPQHVLRRAFAIFLVVMGVLMLVREGGALVGWAGRGGEGTEGVVTDGVGASGRFPGAAPGGGIENT